MLVFEFPLLSLLLPVPLLAWIFLPPNRAATDDTIPEMTFPHIKRIARAFKTTNDYKPRTKYRFIILLSLLWVSLVVSVMHPKWIGEAEYIERKGYDIMLAVDISDSMKALDFAKDDASISRLDIVKKIIGNFVEKRRGDRLGLILFGEHAYLHVPMTFDGIALGQMLNNVVPGMAGSSTSIGDAIGIAVKELRTRPEESRILILLTDGSDTSSNIPPLEAAKIAKLYKIRIYTVEIGNDGLVSYPMPDGKIEKVKINTDEKLLQDIASITEGQYFKAQDDIGLENIYAKINELEKVELTMTQYHSRTLYRYPLSLACIIFLLICLIPLYNRRIYGI